MSLAVLFSFHIKPESCLSRVRLLRKLNPGVPIHGLFTGAPGSEGHFRDVNESLNTHYRHPPAPADWLWRNYDKVICNWYRDQGKTLPWDFLFVHAWDLVTLEPLSKYTSGLTQEDIVLPGVRPIEQMDENVADPRLPPIQPGNWSWLKDGKKDLAAFKQYLLTIFGRAPQIYCEVSPFAILSREFCESYSAVAGPIPGFNEYRFPTLVPLLGYRFANPQFPDNFWKYFNAEKLAINPRAIKDEHSRAAGARIFHPVYEPLEGLLV